MNLLCRVHSETHKNEDIKQIIEYVIHDDKDIVVDNRNVGKGKFDFRNSD